MNCTTAFISLRESRFGACGALISLGLCMSVISGTLAHAQATDPMEPTTSTQSAIVSPLRIVTIATRDMQATRRFYQGAMGMTPTVSTVSNGAAVTLAERWGLPAARALEVVLFTRPGLPDATMVRAVAVAEDMPLARPEYDAEYPGALGVGVPVHGLPKRDQIVTAFGYQSVVGVTLMAFPRADETTYTVGEIHYMAPDSILVLGVDRDDMRPVGPIDPALDIGGPAYSSMVVADAEGSGRFFEEILGLEKRREFNFKSKGVKGGLNLPPGTDVRFQQWFSPGSRTGYLVIMDLLNAGKPAPRPLGLANAGLGMWSFETQNLADVERRAMRAQTRILRPTRVMDLPGVGLSRSLVVATPDGFPVEIYQRVDRRGR